MFISLDTIDVWKVEGEFGAARFFKKLPQICMPNDILVIGSYGVSDDILRWLMANEVHLSDDKKPFSDSCFELNRDEYPQGKSFAMHPTESRTLELSALSEVAGGGVEIDLFFDHLLSYRPGEPLLPLWDFHDAFKGGALYLSGHYSAEIIQGFAAGLKVTAQLMTNPVLLKMR